MYGTYSAYYTILHTRPYGYTTYEWLIGPVLCALQRDNTENSKKIFPEKELRGLSCSLHKFKDRSAYSAAGKYVNRSWEYLCKPLTDTWMCKLGLRPRNSFSENTEIEFSLQCGRSRSSKISHLKTKKCDKIFLLLFVSCFRQPVEF